MFIIMTKRKEYNKKLLSLIEKILNKFPNFRFEQLIYILDGTKDHFYEEPDATLKRWTKNGLEKYL